MAHQMVREVLNTISKDWYERCRIISEEKYELDIQSKLAHARKEERKEWQGVVAKKDAIIANNKAEIANNKAEIARLRKLAGLD